MYIYILCITSHIYMHIHVHIKNMLMCIKYELLLLFNAI